MTKLADRVRVRTVKILADDWFVLKKTTFDYLRRDGRTGKPMIAAMAR
jgi:hypothetical protein